MPDPETVVAVGTAAPASAPVAAKTPSSGTSVPEPAPAVPSEAVVLTSLLQLAGAKAAPEYSRTDGIVDLWFAQCVQGTEVGRYTGAYNAMFAAKEELKRRLAQEN